MTGWTSHVSPIPNFPAYTGPYPVGTIDVEIASTDLLPQSASADARSKTPSTVAFRCFFPCEEPGFSARPVHWVPQPQKETLDAFYKKFLKTNATLTTVFRWMTHFLYYTTIPAIRNAPLRSAPYASKRWPVLVFSHGLAGSRNSYSHICGSLASHGIMVVAPDHRDGSSPIQFLRATPNSKAETIDYRPLPHNPTREVYQGRDEQLQKRLAELSLIHEALVRIDRGEEVNNLDQNENVTKKNQQQNGATTPPGALLAMFRGALDVSRPGRITWAGHSFGGATTIQFTKSVFYSPSDSSLLLFPPSEELKAQITTNTPIILLDPWALPLNSPATSGLNSKPLPCFAPKGPGGDAVLTVLSEAFFNWRGNLNDIKYALRDPDNNSRRPPTHIFYPIRSAHLSQSDYGILFPNTTKLLAKADEPERTLRLNVRAILEVMRRAGLEVSETSPADMETTGPAAADGMKGDASILSRKEDAVRGWVALGVDENEEQETARIERTISKSDEVNGKVPSRKPLLRRSSSAMEAEMVGMPTTELADAAEDGSEEEKSDGV